MRIGIINGSHRPAETQRVARFVQTQLTGGERSLETELVDLADNPLPLWDEGVWDKENKKWPEVWGPVSKRLSACDGFVVLSPEWGGMVPPGLKNMFLLCGNFELAHKPALLVTVSSGIGGSYPVAELRTSSFKNNQICYLPLQVIVRTVGKMLGDEAPTDTFDVQIRERLEHGLELLVRYADCMKPMRDGLGDLLTQFPFGM